MYNSHTSNTFQKTNTVSVLDSSRKSTLFVAPAQIASQAVGMIATIILARNLSVEAFGVYNMFLGSMLVFGFLTNPGIAGSLQRFLPEYARLGKPDVFFKTFFYSISYRTVASVVVFSLAVFLFSRFAGFFHVADYRPQFFLFSIGAYAFFQIEYLTIALNALFLHKYSALGQTAYAVLRCGLIAVALIVVRGGLSLVYMGEIIAYWCAALAFWYVLWCQFAIRRKKGDGGVEWKRFLRFSAYNSATIPGGILFSTAMDYFVVAAMATTHQLGIYSLGSRAGKMLLSNMPQNVLQTVVRPVFYHQYYSVQEKNAELKRMFRALVVLNAAFLFPVLALIGFQAEPILTFVFKAKYAQSTTVFIIFLIFNAFSILDLPCDLVLQTIEKLLARLFAQIFAVYNLVAAILLMPKYGIIGVAFATGSAVMGKCLFYYIMVHRYTGISLNWSPLARISLNTAVAAGSTYAVSLLCRSLLWMLVSLVAGSITYMFMFIINNPLQTSEKELVNRFCKRRIFKV